MKEKLLKLINWMLNRERKVDKQKNYSITIVTGDITIYNIKDKDDDDKEQTS